MVAKLNPVVTTKLSPDTNAAATAAVFGLAVGFAGSYAPLVQQQCTPFNHFWRQRGRNLICSACNEVRGRANTGKRR